MIDTVETLFASHLDSPYLILEEIDGGMASTEESHEDQISLCSLDAEGSLYEEEREQIKDSVTAEACPLLSSFSPPPLPSISSFDLYPALFLLGAREDSEHLSTASLPFCPPHYSLEPSKLTNTQQATEITNKAVPRPPSPISSNLHVEVDLGGSEEVSNAELHALELDYHQDQFEQVQREKEQEVENLCNFETDYVACTNALLPSSMDRSEMTSMEKRAKLMKATTSKAKHESSQLQFVHSLQSKDLSSSQLVKSLSAKSAESANTTSKEPAAKNSARKQLCVADLPFKGELDSVQAEKIADIVAGKGSVQAFLQKYHIEVEMFDQGVSLGEAQVKNSKKSKKTQTKDRTTQDENTETERQLPRQHKEIQAMEVIARTDAKTQVEEKDEYAVQRAVQVTTFDESPMQRYSVMHDWPQRLDLCLSLLSNGFETFDRAAAARHEVSIGRDRNQEALKGEEKRVVEDKYVQVDFEPEDASNGSVSGQSYQHQICQDCQQRKEDKQENADRHKDQSPDNLEDVEGVLANPDEAEAVAALKSLHDQAVLKFEVQTEGAVPGSLCFSIDRESRRQFKRARALELLSRTEDMQDQDQRKSEEEVEGSLLQAVGAEADQEPARKKHRTDFGYVNPDDCANQKAVKPLFSKKRGGQRKSQEQKNEEERKRQWFPLRRTGRSKSKVDYRESGRFGQRDMADGVPSSGSDVDITSRGAIKRSAGAVQNIDQATNKDHPKRALKKNKTN